MAAAVGAVTGAVSVFTALSSLLPLIKAGMPMIEDLITTAEQVGADVSSHKPIVQDISDALAGVEKALAAATGI
jgi:hypothetical protein